MKRKIGLLLGLLLTVNTATAAEELRIYTEQYPPYNMTTNGQPFAHSTEEISGLCTDILKALLANTNLKYSTKLRELSYGLTGPDNTPTMQFIAFLKHLNE